jgi:hypothetical protein
MTTLSPRTDRGRMIVKLISISHTFLLLFTASLIFRPCCQAEAHSPILIEHIPASPQAGWADLSQIHFQEAPLWKKILLWPVNRILDVVDIFRIDAGLGWSTGAVVRVSQYAQFGRRHLDPGSVRLGVFGRHFPVRFENEDEFGAGPNFHNSKDRPICPGELGFGIDLLIPSLYFGICMDELADATLGLVGIDFQQDDLEP